MRLFFLQCRPGTFASATRKKDRIVAAVFSLIFALLCLVGIIISKLNKPDSCENYDKANSIYSEMQWLKEEQFAAPYEPAETTEE